MGKLRENILAQAYLPLTLWWDAFETETYIINRLPTTTLHHHCPFTLLFKTQPQFLELKVFGCACFPYLKCYNTKLAFRSHKCVFIGYSLSHKGYKCLSPTGRIYIADTVSFNEQEFPYTSLFAATSSQDSASVKSSGQLHSGPVFSISPTLPIFTSTYNSSTHTHTQSPAASASASSFTSPASLSLQTHTSTPIPTSSVPPTASISLQLNKHPMTTRSKVDTVKPKVLITTPAPLPTDSIPIKPSLPTAPKYHKLALADPAWYQNYGSGRY